MYARLASAVVFMFVSLSLSLREVSARAASAIATMGFFPNAPARVTNLREPAGLAVT